MVLLGALHIQVVDSTVTLDSDEIWLFNGIAALLLGSRFLNPHFTPPADAATNAFVAASTLLAAIAAGPNNRLDLEIAWFAIGSCIVIFIFAVTVLIARRPVGLESRIWVLALDRLARTLGSPNVIFAGVLIVVVWLFHKDSPIEVFSILTAWTVIAALRPIETTFDYFSWVGQKAKETSFAETVGIVAAYQSPNLVLVDQTAPTSIPAGSPLFVTDPYGNPMVGVVLNYIGQNDRVHLRVYTQPIPDNMHESEVPVMGVGTAIAVPTEIRNQIPLLNSLDRFCGIVDTESNIEFLQIEVTKDDGLTEGRLVECSIGGQPVLYQLTEGVTYEDIIQNRNKYGYARARARKIGSWNATEGNFVPVPWIPTINDPVYLKETTEFAGQAGAVGHFSKTDYPVEIDVSEAVTHNTAILGILGIGKSYLAIELVERMIAANIKAFCLDLTNQYKDELAVFIDARYQDEIDGKLVASGAGGGVAHRSKELGGSHRAFREKAIEILREYVSPNNPSKLLVLNPAGFEVTRQASGMFDGQADMATLTPCEITAIFSEAALASCQELGMTDDARLCLVYEEAHSLVPEWNSVAHEGDRTATSASSRAILQGRKYGLGTLLITQRTANVTKTILNQCNSIFAMRTFDDTGREFLANYIGGEYARMLPSLQARNAVFFGKASSCDNPVAIRLNDRDNFLRIFRAVTEPVTPEVRADENDNAGDDIPF